MIAVLIEAALRALLVAVTVWAGLRLFRVSNVPAQKTAWGLVLVCAVAMPAVMRWELLPAPFNLRLPASIWRTNAGVAPVREAAREAMPDAGFPVAAKTKPAAGRGRNASVGNRPEEPAVLTFESVSAVQDSSARAARFESQPKGTPFFGRLRGWVADRGILPLATMAVFVYLAVCAVLLIRMAYGLHQAIKLWQAAEVFVPYPEDDPGYGLHMRFSRAVSSPVTIGSGVLLPYECLEWDAEKLRMVLAHERAHVRQGDFYLQLLAGAYTAVFWFSPLGWWLKRKLCDLGEAMSDHAGLEEAASHASYAQILLEFAAMPRPTEINLTRIGVAMANRRNLSHRIERLLNETSFRQAFAGTRRRVVLALALVPVALFVGTALVRVEAAAQAVQPPAPATAPMQAAAPNPDAAPNPAAAPDPIVAGAPLVPAIPPTPQTADAPPLPSGPGSTVVPPGSPLVPVLPPEPSGDLAPGRHLMTVDAKKYTVTISSDNSAGQNTAGGNGFAYHMSTQGDSWAVVTGEGQRFSFSGDWNGNLAEQLEKARKMSHGKFLWFAHDGKTYLVDDPEVAARIGAMLKATGALNQRQEELGKRQEELGRQEEKFGEKLELASIPMPDLSEEMAKLNAVVAELDAKKVATVSAEKLAEVEERLAEIQARLGALQGELAAKEGKLGELQLQGRLGEQQGKLGADQGRLAAEQEKMAAEADRMVKSIIDESLRDGKAKPVQ